MKNAKKIAACTLSACVLLSSPLMALGSGNVQCGDINGDGYINNKDLTRLFQYLSGWDVDSIEEAMDVNGDGEVNNKDLTRLFQYLSGWDVSIGQDDNEGIKVESFVYGKSEMGRDLVCYSIAPKEYKKTILMNFAIHGFEDEYAHDGEVLTRIANKLIEYYSDKKDLNNTRLLIIPCANPDGEIDGVTNNGFGRCNSNGIDLNRDFDANYVSYSSARNYTPYAFSASESRALRDLCLANSPYIVLDFHGWLDETIGDPELAAVFDEEMGLKHYVSFTSSNARGYFSNWAHQQGALGLLVEFTSSTQVNMDNLKNALNRLIEGRFDYDDGTGEYAIDRRYETFSDIKCYTISSGHVTTYKAFDTPFSGLSYIDGETDLCTIKRVYKNGWVKVEYPISNGIKTAFCYLSDFIDPDNEVEMYTGHTTVNTLVYRTSAMSESLGTVYSTDVMYVVAERGDLLQIIYPLDAGGWEMGWIKRSELND